MPSRVALYLLTLLFAGHASAQELRGKEASEFLAMASAKIKANCDAIKSWKGKIEAHHDESNIQSDISVTFTVATNSDVLVHLDKMSGYTVMSRGSSGSPLALHEPNKPHSIEFFVHGDVVDRVTFPVAPIPVESTLPSRSTTQVSKSKFEDGLRSTYLNPQLLFVDNGNARIDQHLEIESQSALREDSTVVVAKPIDGKGIWILKVQYKGSDPTAPKILVTWSLDEAQSYLPISRSETWGAKKLGERTLDYQQVGTVFLPKLVVETRNKRSSQFKVTTESLNQGPEKIEIKHRDNDLLTDVDRNHFKFLNGEFRPYDPVTRQIKK